MANQEIYVRGVNDTEARGPFSMEQLASLVEAGQVTQDTYYYDATTEQWLLVTSNAEMKAVLWPEKKRMGFKHKEFKAVNEDKSESAPPITVQDFLNAAEGKTDETKGKKDKNVSMMAAAIWGTRSAAIISLASAVALILPGADALSSMDFGKIILFPGVLLGATDAVIGLLLLLGVIQIYPFVRFRAVFGLGFLGFLFMTQGQLTPMIAVAAGSVGLYFCTIFLSYIPLAVAALLGLGGMAMLATMSYA
ncbi:MAG TPA: GYF domain-containing protein [Lacunisphaera sp.]|nr:GYF domain-containing protein [Lacunisphaera sp.]